MTVRASILVPTHSRAETLNLAVASALAQSIEQVEVLIIGDGVTDGVRSKALALSSADSRVRFFDNPKGPNHGEQYRHDAILAARSDAIFYLCDDDLFMPGHVSDLLALLETHNFVQSLNGWIDPLGRVDFYPANLADSETISWHLRDDIRFNAVSITGTAHSRHFYERIADPWTTTPTGFWPDHYQARKFFRNRRFAGATSGRMTALQFPALQDGRDEWTDERRLVELQGWADIASSPGGQDYIDTLVAAAVWPRMERDSRLIAALQRDIAMVHPRTEGFNQLIAALQHDVTTLQHDVNTLQHDVSTAQSATRAIQHTWSWRLTRPLRLLRKLGRRRDST